MTGVWLSSKATLGTLKTWKSLLVLDFLHFCLILASKGKMLRNFIISWRECQCFQIKRATSAPGLGVHILKCPGKYVSTGCPLGMPAPSCRVLAAAAAARPLDAAAESPAAAYLHTRSLLSPHLCPSLTWGKSSGFYIKCVYLKRTQETRD
jgi:hypothetical protein